MTYTPKEMQCKCGNVLVVDKKRVWCTGCGQPVYHDPKKQRMYKINNVYMILIIVSVMGFIAFLFIEMIAIPIFKVNMP